MSAITTHVLDLARGRPASGVPVLLELLSDAGEWQAIGLGKTDTDGRLRDLIPGGESPREATYRLTFDTGQYFAAQNIESFYPQVTVVFSVRDREAHYHVPLLLSPYGYSTYRGS
jgi:5-hydroxyisourate hydrolase